MSNQVAIRIAATAEQLLTQNFVHVKQYMEEQEFDPSKPIVGLTAAGRQRTTNIWEYVHTALVKMDPDQIHQFLLPTIPGKAGVMFSRKFLDEQFKGVWMDVVNQIIKRENAEVRCRKD